MLCVDDGMGKLLFLHILIEVGRKNNLAIQAEVTKWKQLLPAWTVTNVASDMHEN